MPPRRYEGTNLSERSSRLSTRLRWSIAVLLAACLGLAAAIDEFCRTRSGPVSAPCRVSWCRVRRAARRRFGPAVGPAAIGRRASAPCRPPHARPVGTALGWSRHGSCRSRSSPGRLQGPGRVGGGEPWRVSRARRTDRSVAAVDPNGCRARRGQSRRLSNRCNLGDRTAAGGRPVSLPAEGRVGPDSRRQRRSAGVRGAGAAVIRRVARASVRRRGHALH